MKLCELKQGDRFRLAQYPNSAPYVKGGEVPGSAGTKYYVHSTTIGYVYVDNWDEEVIKVEG